MIKTDVLTTQVEEPIKLYQPYLHSKDILTLDLKYEVKMSTNDLLSVMYTGSSKIVGGLFPTQVIHTLTIDLQNAKKLKLTDFTDIDANLAQKIKKSTAVSNATTENKKQKEGLIFLVQSDSDETIIRGLKGGWGYYTFCVTPNSLLVSVSVNHAAGDYAIVELHGSYTKK